NDNREKEPDLITAPGLNGLERLEQAVTQKHDSKQIEYWVNQNVLQRRLHLQRQLVYQHRQLLRFVLMKEQGRFLQDGGKQVPADRVAYPATQSRSDIAKSQPHDCHP